MIKRIPLLKDISDHEVCRLYNTATEHGDFDIDEEQFVRVASRDWKRKLQIDLSTSALTHAGMHFEQLCSSKVKILFDKYDESDDGIINAEELANLLADIGKKVNETELQTIHRIIDMDGSGTIDFVEFMYV
jgi:Ca2+-binding EF-hand superfamily protein